MSAAAGRLDVLLRNEADMAAARRVRTVIEYLQISPQDLVLDCGCGLGWFLKVVEEVAPCRLSGIDSDWPRLRAARRELRPSTGLASGDVTRLPYADATFDKIILSEVLEHLPDDRAGLMEVRRILKPGGLIAITVPNRDYPMLWDPINRGREKLGLAPIRDGFFGGIWTHHVRLYLREELIALVQGADLIVEDVRQFVHHCFPFAHNLVYGLGMRLVQSGLLREEDRFRYDRAKPVWHPLELARRIFRSIDARNHPVSDEGRSTVILSVKARKPQGRA
ncbi:MAG TPA: class I SAM-dependent methyltransferase [Thermoanaerobaculia bacterium]